MTRLTLAVGPYERVRALLSGEVRPEGIELAPTTLPAARILERMAAGAEFDVGELSLSDALRAFAEGGSAYVALPVFPYRAFRQSMLWVRASSELTRLADLRGKRIGIPGYGVTALLYVRGLLQEEHDIAPSEVTWVRTAPERLALRVPGVVIEDVRSDLDTLLGSGAVDAIATFHPPAAARGRPPRARRLVPNVREVEADYYRRTGIFPIMHVIGLRASVHESDATIAPRLVAAFELAKRRANDEVTRSFAAHSLTPWSRYEVEETLALFGDDAFPYGVDPNRPSLEAACRYARAQLGLDLPGDVAELFTRT